MNENLKKFLEYASQNEDVRQKIDALKEETDKDTVIAKSIEIAKEAGFSLSAEDFAAEEPSGELSEDELDAVAGGRECYCADYGTGPGSDKLYYRDFKRRTMVCLNAGEELSYETLYFQ